MTRASPFPQIPIGSLAAIEPGSFKIGPFGSSLRAEELVREGIPVLGIENVHPNRLIAAFRRFITPEKFAQLSQYRVTDGDVLVTTMGTIGRAAVVPKGLGTAIIDSHLFRMRLDQSRVYPKYLCYAINDASLYRQLERMATGSIMSGLNTTILRECTIPLPVLAEQRRIAAVLDEQMAAVERARAAAEQQLDAARALPSAYLRAVFEGDEARAWPLVRIADVADTASGTTPSRGRPDYYAGTTPWVKTAELRDGRISDTEEHVSDIAIAETSLRVLPRGTLLIAMYGQGQTRGRTGLLDVPSTTNQACFAVLPNHKRFVPRYLQLWFQYSYHRLRRESEARGNSQPNLNGDVLRQQMFPLAPLQEQHRVANQVDRAMEQAAALRSQLETRSRDLDFLPATLLRCAFRGET